MSVSLSEVIVNIKFVSRRSCFELLLSVPENEIPFEAWVQFHHSVQVQHCDLLNVSTGGSQAISVNLFACILCSIQM